MRIRCYDQLILMAWLAARGGRKANIGGTGTRVVLLRTNDNSTDEALCDPTLCPCLPSFARSVPTFVSPRPPHLYVLHARL